MGKDKIVLKDGTEIELESGASLGLIQVVSKNKNEMISIWEKMSAENLSKIQILNSSGVVCGTYADLLLVSERSKEQADGTILTSFCFREKTDIEKRVDVLDGAVNDLGSATSALAEQIGGET